MLPLTAARKASDATPASSTQKSILNDAKPGADIRVPLADVTSATSKTTENGTKLLLNSIHYHGNRSRDASGIRARPLVTTCGNALQLPIRNFTLRAYRDMPQVDLPKNSTHVINAVERRKVLCYLRSLLDPCQVPSFTRPGYSLRSFLTQGPRTCAVVSNSGIMKLLSEGDNIDAADMVMRFNTAKLVGYHKIAGRKDNVRFVNMHFAQMVLAGAVRAHRRTLYICTLPTGVRSAVSWKNLARKRPDLLLFRLPNKM
eukprot:2480961-Amphidinium_carterae.1